MMKRRAHYQQRRAEADGYTIVKNDGMPLVNVIIRRQKSRGSRMKELMNKKWRTKDGRDARIVCVDLKHENYPVLCLVTRESGIEDMFALTEELHFCREPYITEVMPWDDIKLDDPVVCWNKSGHKYKGYFAGVDCYGKPKTWLYCRTSFSADGRACAWRHCRPATEAEIAGGEIEE